MTKYTTYTIILNYKNYEDTIECIESLLNLEGANRNRIVLVDNNSPNDSCQHIQKWLEACGESYEITDKTNSEQYIPDVKIIFIRNNENKGYASGNNVGIKNALSDSNCKYIWILNNDTTVEKTALAEQFNFYENAYRSNRKIGMLGSSILYYHKPNTIQCIGCRYDYIFGFPKQIGLNAEIDKFHYDGKPFDYVSGASIFFSRDVFLKFGLLNEDFFLYFEEIDFATRLKRNGYTVDVCLKSIIYHKEGASTKDDPKSTLASPFSDYHFTRSKLIFTGKFFPQYLFSNYLSLIIVIINRLRRRQFRNIWPVVKAGLKK